MSKNSEGHWTMFRLLLAVFVLATCIAQSQNPRTPNQPERLKAFLRGYIARASGTEDLTTTYALAWVDLKDNGIYDALVYLSGDGWCGTGGCTMLIVASDGVSYRVVTRVTVARLPITILDTKSNGWHDIGISVAGGGVQPGYQAILAFNGKKYPGNPSVPPARGSRGIQGKIVIDDTTKDEPLYCRGRFQTQF